jgi:hypothetical protein
LYLVYFSVCIFACVIDAFVSPNKHIYYPLVPTVLQSQPREATLWRSS